ncbi:S58 family peptidase, partial [archaeon]|nr:S58 family peptidase [archaeon]
MGERVRARDLGVRLGQMETGELNAITDVKGVGVGHSTIISGDDVRTVVTAIV